jgi:hypothetical protein
MRGLDMNTCAAEPYLVSDPATQGQVFELFRQLNETMLGQHIRIRQTVEDGISKLSAELDLHAKEDRAVALDHGNRLLIIENERKLEAAAAKRIEERAVSRSTWVTVWFTAGLGLLELVSHWHGWH